MISLDAVEHLDIKPSNIGFGREDVPKLLDFGLARLAARVQMAPTTDRTGATGIGFMPRPPSPISKP